MNRKRWDLTLTSELVETIITVEDILPIGSTPRVLLNVRISFVKVDHTTMGFDMTSE